MNNEYDSGEEAAVETLLGMAHTRDQSNRNIPPSSPRHSESELESDIETDTPYSRRRRLRRRQMRVGFADPLHQDTPDNVVQARLAPAVGRRPIKKATKSNSKGSSTSDNGRAASSKTTKSAKTTKRAGPTKAKPVAAAKKRKQTKAVSFPPSTPTPARGRTFIISDNDDSSDGQDEVDSTDGVVELPRKRLKRGSGLANVQGFGTGSQPGISSPIASPAANSASQSTNKIYNLFGKTMKNILTLIPYLDGLALPKKMTAASLVDINREKILEVAQSIAKSQAMKRFEPLVYHHETKASFSAAMIDSRTKPVVENDIDLSTDNDAKEFRAVLHYQYHELNLQNLKITIEVKYGTTFEPLPTPVPIPRQSTTAASSGSTLSLAHPLTPAVQAITTANTDKSRKSPYGDI
ncbi:hypothetical protein P152DRAFT_450923 [Eremomyces bilateralis CBS 781.70]|uniref:Uncharacterized protein n=1 Tax=Eremomyces bilateralis CBS 781.70 TaxID=1392243 RepID=A0A6G1FXZ7_9PEZI|nr:uncharacterized protein P152DRAFT_450923 [Eremomyces bilateralis CBS 781.70]KAF1810546.1 hypothetical protein P152DRAFT_450923 [Eremomyces bilateralis CBS 781.70]